MSPRLKTSLRCCSRAALLRWATVGLCVASLVANLALYLANQAIPASLLVLHLVATLGAAVQLGLGARSISLRPAELAERMLKVQEDERQHLSRELHDDIGQLLTAAKLQLQWLQRRIPDELQGHCDALRGTLDDTLGNVRDVSALLNPRQLASLGLEASLRAHLVRTLASSSVHWSLACNQRLGGIDEAVAMAVFRITQEAVTNMLRHAQANNLVIRLQRNPEGLALSIHDDGRGFIPARHPAEAGQRGLAGMQERVTALQGSLDITSQPGLGTQIEAIFPWPPRSQQRARSTATHDL
ncbi:sensor histidine kinase [Pseudomonas monteilii]|uniref:histidine kinase n=1 Tax=Pseudomonas monteilii TaxID=76759 RepID=A0AAP7FKP5_9PSED|nr:MULTISPECIES: sensor histidine kinase [Pseudomonas]AYN15268.1 sensor histidine kinase [Pseudomonas monteilii]AYO01120.1 sensor histidine kinase [Pseudomonas sp. LTGT-11-2Z]MBA6103499.1 sensor histidine kinase [Pseudomonas monteilii]MCE0873021.1 sensor histidine kinase [Pseudomonas monteilii]MCE0926377.1 sensor histidine kinase [Pseudomonas monteilii]